MTPEQSATLARMISLLSLGLLRRAERGSRLCSVREAQALLQMIRLRGRA